MALGPIFWGVCIGVWRVQPGVRVAFNVTLTLALLAVWLQQRLIEGDTGPASAEDCAITPEKTAGTFVLPVF
jgi:hypothetical protein